MQNQVERIHEKLEGFIRKYYRDKLIKGGIYFATLLAVLFIVIATFLYFGSFSVPVRTSIFWAFIGFTAFILWKFVLPPSFGLLKLSGRMSSEEAASLLGKYFPEVSDRLLNLIQLERIGQADSELILASIEQKAENLKDVPFESAIEIKRNWKTATLLLIPLGIVLIFTFSGNVNILSDGSKRMIAHRTDFQAAAPYQIILGNEVLQAVQNESFTLKAKISGNQLPEKLFLAFDGKIRRMEKTGPDEFQYKIDQVRKPLEFKFQTELTSSQAYLLDIIPRPFLEGFSIKLDYPSYTQIKDQRIENQADLSVPEGTVIQWDIQARDTRFMKLKIFEEISEFEEIKENLFQNRLEAKTSSPYTIIAGNDFQQVSDTAFYALEVIKDQFPKINLEEFIDSTDSKQRYYTLQGKDDYGFTKLELVLTTPSSEIIRKLKLPKGNLQFSTFETLDLDSLNLKPGQELRVKARLYDNDAVNGPKVSESQTIHIKRPSLKAIKESRDQDNEKIKEKLEENLGLAREIKEDIENLNREMLNKKELSWEDQQRLEELIRKQKALERNQKQVEKLQEQQKSRQSELNQNEELLNKQKQLEELMDKVMDEDMRKKMEEIQRMMEELNKEDLEDALRDLEKDQESLEEELDRNLELFKRLEVEQELTETIEELEELQKAQEDLSKESPESEEGMQELKEQQDSLNQEFKELSEDYKKLQEKNNELEEPMRMDDFQKQEEEIKKDMEEAQENLKQNQRQEAGQKQKEAAEEMKKMAEAMQSMQQQSSMQQSMEDMEDLRQLLDNLLEVSLDQEALLNESQEMNPNNPKFVDLIRAQNKLISDSRIVEDSLRALAKRVVQIESIITDELETMIGSMDRSLEFLTERQGRAAGGSQQEAMTSANNLALLLSDVLKQMQEAMANKMPGNQQCQKPGNGKPNPSTMNQLQQQLNEQMKALQKMLEEGKKPGEKPGKKPGGGMGMSKELARMAARQEALRQQLQELLREQGEDGTSQSKSLQKAIEEMEKTEEDLLNQRISPETLKRQEEILTRLLEAETAERERKQDKERESKEAQEIERKIPDSFLEYQKEKERQSELFKTLPQELRPFYKHKTSDYFNTIDND